MRIFKFNVKDVFCLVVAVFAEAFGYRKHFLGSICPLFSEMGSVAKLTM